MKIPYVNKFSWFPVSYHHNVDDSKLVRINLNKDIQVRYNLNKGKLIVIRSRFIDTNKESKINKIDLIKSKLLIKSNDLKEVKNFYNENKNLIINIVR